ncbi:MULTISPECIES: DUF397 domain-containing protein [Streptosporangium]|uniref:DUF397 domain-containing protein n=1 Tax=Streptosporangium brasiliense TaxID=47480 RepID=A0ABT9QZW6_9ACTN|nr:DUF397 domain-containing protein [Streptosporangium brasiliense]MDP9862509.1 hypothetical protein [Streptosporangium brasiliense]
MDSGSRFHGAVWRSKCNNGTCVEIASQGGWVGVRDSKDGGTGPVLSFTQEEWSTFVKAVKNGAFDV